ncbi:uncharacterized protein LOC121968408 [Zingiber officinale]|uniref:Uncharacterized protein n=1 Tax=Zingiber officinale TaxID=94328 RepID=A0A8J5LMI6_ZINOF|nr:uncharacterized protein LOC121968408 [Zingiber officinale]KAG6518644.1 hypothetical protein ZIOFF_022124 [Zingiber officinale]
MAEDLRLPAELLDDGFFHGFIVDDNDKVRDLLNEVELRRWIQHQHRLPNQARNPSPFLAHRQLQAARIRHLKQQQLMQQQFWLERQRNAKGVGGGHCPSFSPSRRTPFQVQHQPLPASGMNTVFLSVSGARKGPTGTGVFLPRTSNNKPQPQKKSDSFLGRRTNPVRTSPQPGVGAAAIRTPMSCLPQEWTY